MKPQDELIKICQESGFNINKLKRLNWRKISKYKYLSEEFITEYKEQLDAIVVSVSQKLSEEFIDQNKSWLCINCISCYQSLSESFIQKNKDWLDPILISRNQKLSESFIKNNKDWLDSDIISIFHQLSEFFIAQNKEWLDPISISKYQILSEPFIDEHKDWLYMPNIVKYQKLSDTFIKENDLKVNKVTNTLYWNTEQKIELLLNNGWKIDKDGYVKAWKGLKKDRMSAYDRRIIYNVGETYTAHCDCNLDEENSFGLSAWTYEKAKEYYDEIAIEVRFKPEWLGAITPEGKLRLHKLEVLS